MLTVATFNLRCDTATEDGANHFDFRREGIARRVRAEAPEAIGFQEMTGSMLAYMESALPEYLFLGCGREKGFGGEHNSIAIRKDAVEAHALDTFWLSSAPHAPGVKYAGAGCARVCTLARLYHSPSGTLFYLFNTHLDHVSARAQALGLRQIAARIRAERRACRVPTFLTGDFNFTPDEGNYALLADGFPLRDVTDGIETTFNGFGRYPQGKIDYILVDPETAALPRTLRVWRAPAGELPLSDHDALALTIE